jgi:putative transposase
MDESGLLMAPLVRRSWAPQGQPPILVQQARHREKVSVAAALWLTPARDQLALAYQTLVNGYFTAEAVAEFLGGALQGLEQPVVVIWDGGTMHKGHPIRDLVEEADGRLDLETLPAHASELMPVEQLWTWLKYDRLCNWAPPSVGKLDEVVRRELEAVKGDQERLRNFFRASDLPLPRALLS